MDFVTLVFFSSISFILVLMSNYDRTIGIAGILLQFVTIAVAGYDGTIVMARGWDINANPLQQTTPVYPTFIVLGFVLIAVYFVIFMKINQEYSTLNRKEE